ncbi:MAG: hypothetical protein E6J82_10490, partial [Deltaproteobacteria bacterium]
MAEHQQAEGAAPHGRGVQGEGGQAQHALHGWLRGIAVSDLAPGLLIAVPQLDDPNFARSVVLLIEHNESGAMGIVFNRPSDIGLQDIGKEHGMEVHESAGNAFIGGPVQRERGFLVH